MLATLIRYECKKSIGNRFFVTVFCLFLLLQVIWLGGFQEWTEYQAYLQEMESYGLSIPQSERLSIWELLERQRSATNQLREEYAVIGQLSSEEQDEFAAAMREKYGENVFDPMEMIPTEEMYASSGYFEGFQDVVMIQDFCILQSWNQTIEDTHQTVVKTAASYLEQSIAEGDEYGIRRNQNIIRLYSIPQSRITSPISGWDLFLSDNYAFLLSVLLIFLACSGSVSSERERKTWMLLHTAKNGRRKTLAAKYLSGAGIAAGIVITMQLASFGAVGFRCGFLGTEQSVQALDQLSLCPYSFTVWQYALLRLGLHIVSAVFLSVLLTTISACSRSSIISYAVGAVVLGGSLMLAYFPPKAELLAGPLSLSVPATYFESYYTANLLGFPVLWAIIQAAVWCLLCCGSILLADRVYHRKRGVL